MDGNNSSEWPVAVFLVGPEAVAVRHYDTRGVICAHKVSMRAPTTDLDSMINALTAWAKERRVHIGDYPRVAIPLLGGV